MQKKWNLQAPTVYKFALGENVKRSASTQAIPVFLIQEWVLNKYWPMLFSVPAITKKQWRPTRHNKKRPELDALVEIMNKNAFITCHSYVQSEINATMKVAEKFGFL